MHNKMANATVLLVMNFLALCVAMAGISVGAAGCSWWKKDNPIEFTEGLWRACAKTNCSSRENILEFTDFHQEKDIILTLLLCGGFFTAVATVSALCLCCCKESYGGWKCGSVVLLIFSWMAVAANVGAMTYAEIKFKDEWDTFDHGWSAISAWVGAGMCVFTFFMAISLMRLSPTTRKTSAYIENFEESHQNQSMTTYE